MFLPKPFFVTKTQFQDQSGMQVGQGVLAVEGAHDLLPGRVGPFLWLFEESALEKRTRR